MPAATFAPIRAGSADGWCSPTARSAGRSISRRFRATQRIDAHLTANNANFPDAFAVRSGRADGIIILADDRTTIDGTVDARGISAGAVTLARLTANAKLVNGSGQVRAAFAGRRGAAFAFSTVADISPDADPADRKRPDRTPAAGPQPGRRADPLGRRLGARSDQSQLCRRDRDRVRPQRLASRGPRAGPGAAARSARPVLAGHRSQRLRDRPARLCLEGQSATAAST